MALPCFCPTVDCIEHFDNIALHLDTLASAVDDVHTRVRFDDGAHLSDLERVGSVLIVSLTHTQL